MSAPPPTPPPAPPPAPAPTATLHARVAAAQAERYESIPPEYRHLHDAPFPTLCAGLDLPALPVEPIPRAGCLDDAFLPRPFDDGAYPCENVAFVPQRVFTALGQADATDNHVYGRTVNAFDRSFTAGGSSGGEGALLALRGSPCGTGTDIGGSIRIPASFHGLFALRPSSDRLPYRGSRNTLLGLEGVRSVLGPMAPQWDVLAVYMQAVLAGEPWRHDPAVHPLPWDQPRYEASANRQPRTLRIAIQWTDGIVRPSPPVHAALQEVEARLRSAGVDVVDWDHSRAQLGAAPAPTTPRIGNAAIRLLCADLYAQDGGTENRLLAAAAGGEPEMYNMVTAFARARARARARAKRASAGGADATPAAEGEASAAASPPPQPLPATEVMRLNQLSVSFRETFSDTWEHSRIDALLAPVAPLPAHPHNARPPPHVFYTAQFNFFDRPCVVFPVPVGPQSQSQSQRLREPEPEPEPGEPSEAPKASEEDAPRSPATHGPEDAAFASLYSCSSSPHRHRWAGMPVCLQLVGSRLREEELLGVGEALVRCGIVPRGMLRGM